MPPRVLVVGDVMTDISVEMSGPIAWGSDRRAKISALAGGSAANQAVWLAKLGLEVDFVARVGARDVFGESERLRAYGVTPHLAADETLETGRLIALVDVLGERSFLTDRGANDALSEADVSDALIAGASHIHLSGYSFVAPLSRETVRGLMRRAGKTPVSVDPGSAEFLREMGARNFLEFVAGAKMLFPNAEEAATLSGRPEAEAQGVALAEKFALVVIKRGALGAEAYAGDQRWRAVAPSATIVDTTGAGDAFVAAFLAARLRGADIPTCLEQAVAAGSAATEFLGGRPPL
jgi:sugar/nucleoside kinase (ribokinase family)